MYLYPKIPTEKYERQEHVPIGVAHVFPAKFSVLCVRKS